MNIIAMIPARLGSQRLAKKNLRELDGVPLIVRAIRRCKKAGVFDQIWVNSESEVFAPIVAAEGALFHQRPAELGDNKSTSEDYIAEFLRKHPCDFLVQAHSIAPLLTVTQIKEFTARLKQGDCDVLLSYVPERIECAYEGVPVNFSFDRKTNSQELKPLQRIPWSITAWRRAKYLEAAEAGACATYAGKVAFHPIDRLAGHVIKTEEDLKIAEALLKIRQQESPDDV